jgi:hypothetical protein
MFKVFGDGRWLIFQDENYFGAIKKVDSAEIDNLY